MTISVAVLLGAISYALYWLFWARGGDISRMLFVFGGPVLIPIAMGILGIAKKRFRAGVGVLAGAALIGVVVLASGYGGCTMERRPSIVVAVHDAKTGESLREASVVITDGRFSAQLDDPSSSFTDGGERPGTYVVTVSHAGYEIWQRRGVRVRQELYCGHVKTVRLRADLDPD